MEKSRKDASAQAHLNVHQRILLYKHSDSVVVNVTPFHSRAGTLDEKRCGFHQTKGWQPQAAMCQARHADTQARRKHIDSPLLMRPTCICLCTSVCPE